MVSELIGPTVESGACSASRTLTPRLLMRSSRIDVFQCTTLPRALGTRPVGYQILASAAFQPGLAARTGHWSTRPFGRRSSSDWMISRSAHWQSIGQKLDRPVGEVSDPDRGARARDQRSRVGLRRWSVPAPPPVQINVVHHLRELGAGLERRRGKRGRSVSHHRRRPVPPTRSTLQPRRAFSAPPSEP
jgi:hypothetical protein